MTQQFQSFGRILRAHASGISQARIDGDFKRIINGSNNNDGIYHWLSPRIKESLLRMAICEALTVRVNKTIALKKQCKHKQHKQDML